MLDSIFASGSLTLEKVLLVLSLSLLLGYISSWFYTRQNAAVSRSFAVTLVVLPMITTAVIMVVNGNLGAGIAVAGSFSLIRFRSAQGSGQEILAVFLSAALGLCLGAGYVAIACLLILFYLLILFLLRASRFGAEDQMELRISIPEILDYEGLFDDLLTQYFTASSLDQVRTVEMGTSYQLIYHVTPREQRIDKAFLDSIRERNGNLPVSLGRIPDTHTAI